MTARAARYLLLASLLAWLAFSAAARAETLHDVAEWPTRRSLLATLEATAATRSIATALDRGDVRKATVSADALLATHSNDETAHLAWLLARYDRGADEAVLTHIAELGKRDAALAGRCRSTFAAIYFADRRLYRAELLLQARPSEASRRPADDDYLLAHIWARQRRIDPALEQLERLAAAHPEAAAIARDQAQLERVAGREERALVAARRWRRLAPTDADARLAVAEALFRAGRDSAATAELEAMLADGSRNPVVQLTLGLLHLTAERTEAALAAFVAARVSGGGDARAWLAEAAAALRVGDVIRAEDAASEARRINPYDPLGELYEALATPGDLGTQAGSAAVDWFPDLARIPPTGSIVNALQDPDTRGSWAVVTLLARERGPAAAAKWFERSGAAEPLAAALIRARFGLLARDSAGALRWLNEAATLPGATGVAGIDVLRTGIHLVQKDHERALMSIGRVDRLSDAQWPLRLWVARAYGQAGRPADALAAYERAAATGGMTPEAQAERAAMLADTGASRNFSRALSIVGRELEGKPHYLTRARLLSIRADCLYRLGRRAQAFAAYQSLSSTVGGITEPAIWQRYAELALSRGDRRTARHAFEEALDLGRPHPLSPRAVARVRALEPP